MIGPLVALCAFARLVYMPRAHIHETQSKQVPATGRAEVASARPTEAGESMFNLAARFESALHWATRARSTSGGATQLLSAAGTLVIVASAWASCVGALAHIEYECEYEHSLRSKQLNLLD